MILQQNISNFEVIQSQQDCFGNREGRTPYLYHKCQSLSWTDWHVLLISCSCPVLYLKEYLHRLK